MLVVQRFFRAKRTNLHEKYDYPAVGASTAVLHSAQVGMERVVLASAKADRDRSATLLSSKVTVVTNALTAVARRAPVEAWKDPAAMGRYLLDKPAIASVFAAVVAIDTQGQVMVRIEGDHLTNVRSSVADSDYFRRAMASDQPVMSEAYLSPILHAPVVALAIPVLAADGSHRGIIAATLLLQSTALFDDLRSAGDDDGVKDLVIDRAGRILAHADPLRLMQAAQSEPGLEVVVPEWIAVGSPIDTAGVARIEGEHVVSFTGIPLTDWAHVRVAKAAVALAPVREARAAAWPAVLIAGLAAGLLAGTLGYAITRPISRLRSLAEKLLDDQHSVSDWPEDRGEVGQLANAFRQVVEQRACRQVEVQALLAQLEAVLDHAEVGIALTRDGLFELVSRQFCHIFRCEKADAIGESTRLIHPSDEAYQALIAMARPALIEQGHVDTELRLARRNGQIFWARMRGRVAVAGDASRGTIWTIEDVTAARDQR